MKLNIVSSFPDRLKEAIKDESATAVAIDIGMSKQAISMYLSGKRSPKRPTIEALARRLNVNPAWLCGYDVQKLPNIEKEISKQNISLVPILGIITAGLPILATEHIEGYELAPVSDPENYFYLRVKGDSMVGARIMNGDKVLVKKQGCAENGQIIVCLVNGEEATVKRFREAKDVVILQPENSSYEPIIVSKKDFDNGYAKVLGVVISVQFNI